MMRGSLLLRHVFSEYAFIIISNRNSRSFMTHLLDSYHTAIEHSEGIQEMKYFQELNVHDALLQRSSGN